MANTDVMSESDGLDQGSSTITMIETEGTRWIELAAGDPRLVGLLRVIRALRQRNT
ncbi:Uncharacterised protein [Mycobacteroides abscessus subsp. abscessus]|jgi:hypothetical protein|nr:Uncharacterised protein [Mycobacteroides abscessus subsp. abscessus]